MDYHGSTDLTPEKPEDVVPEVIRQLKSGHGDIFSATKPYKIVRGAKATAYSYDPKKGEVTGQITIDTDNQSPHGTNADWDYIYKITRNDARVLAEIVPEEFSRDFIKILLDFDREHTRYLESQRQLTMKIILQFATGKGVPLQAPERASFKKKKNRHPAPGRN